MSDDDLKLIRERWIREVYDRASDVDPGDEWTWGALLVGFLLGAGVDLDTALKIEIEAPGGGWSL